MEETTFKQIIEAMSEMVYLVHKIENLERDIELGLDESGDIHFLESLKEGARKYSKIIAKYYEER